MRTLNTVGAASARAQKDDACELGGGAGINVQSTKNRQDSRSSGVVDQAGLTISGKQCADAYLLRLYTDAVHPDDLASLLAFLPGEMPHGACRAIEQVLRGGSHA